MRNIFSTLMLAALLVLGACSESDYSDKYANPAKTSTVSCEKLMTGVFWAAREYTMPSYMRYFTFETQQIGRFSQTMGFINGKGMYLGMGEGYNNTRWMNFYNALTQFRLLENTYNNLSEVEKPSYEVTIFLSKIFLYEQLQEVVDLWGDIPYSEAGYLAITSDVAASRPSYDDATTLYQMMLDDLKEINTELASLTTNSLMTSYLTAQDYINKGNLTLWRKYCNSLRLRIAMRATSGDLATEAKAAIAEMLADPTTYPVVDSNDETIKIAADTDGFKVLDWIRDGFESWAGVCNRASDEMVSALTGDPRLTVVYDPNKEGNYYGINTADEESVQQANFDRAPGNYYAAVDTATFSRNASFPGILMTAAEVSFIKAEAYQKGYASGSAQTAFETGVKQSVDFYYYLNALGTYRADVTAPTSAVTTAFATARWSAYSSKEEAIATQKWLHLGLIQMVQAWAEVRRTGLPALSFQTDDATSYCPTVPDRLRYPTDERDNNTANYNEATSSGTNDTYYVKLFWAK